MYRDDPVDMSIAEQRVTGWASKPWAGPRGYSNMLPGNRG
jgi:hypothetical protein